MQKPDHLGSRQHRISDRAAPALARNEVAQETSTVPLIRNYDDEVVQCDSTNAFGVAVIQPSAVYDVCIMATLQSCAWKLDSRRRTLVQTARLAMYWCCMDDGNLALCRRPRAVNESLCRNPILSLLVGPNCRTTGDCIAGYPQYHYRIDSVRSAAYQHQSRTRKLDVEMTVFLSQIRKSNA